MKKTQFITFLLITHSVIFTAEFKKDVWPLQRLEKHRAYNPLTHKVTMADQLIGAIAFPARENKRISIEEIEATKCFAFSENHQFTIGEMVIVSRTNNTYTFGIIIATDGKQFTVQLTIPNKELLLKEKLSHKRLGKILLHEQQQQRPLQGAAPAAAKK